MKIDRILVPLDFSDTSLAALDAATALARSFGAEMLLVSVVEPMMAAVDLYGAAEVLAKADEETTKAYRSRLADRQRRLAGRGLKCRVVLGRGYAESAIVDLARAHKADLIVMGTHGRTGVSHLFIGSVAERVVRTAPCPVLTVRGPAPTTKRGRRKR